MHTKNLDSAREIFVGLDTLEDIHRAIDIFGLIFPKIEIDGVEDVVESDRTMKGREKEPCTEMVPWDIACNARPYFWRSTLRWRVACEMYSLGVVDRLVGRNEVIIDAYCTLTNAVGNISI